MGATMTANQWWWQRVYRAVVFSVMIIIGVAVFPNTYLWWLAGGFILAQTALLAFMRFKLIKPNSVLN